MKYLIYIYDPSEEYRKRIAGAIAARYMSSVCIHTFDSFEKMTGSAVENRPDLILSDIGSAEKTVDSLKKITAVLSTDGDADYVCGFANVYRYLPVSEMYRRITDIISRSVKNKGDRCKTAAFASFYGGIGNSTAALSYSIAAAVYGKRCVLLSFDPFDVSTYADGGEGNLSDLLIYAIENRDNPSECIRKCMYTDESGLYVVRRPSDPADLIDTGTAEKAAVIDYLKNSGMFDLIVSDIPRLCSRDSFELAERHDVIYSVIRNTREENRLDYVYLSEREKTFSDRLKPVLIEAKNRPGTMYTAQASVKIPFAENLSSERIARKAAAYWKDELSI